MSSTLLRLSQPKLHMHSDLWSALSHTLRSTTLTMPGLVRFFYWNDAAETL